MDALRDKTFSVAFGRVACENDMGSPHIALPREQHSKRSRSFFTMKGPRGEIPCGFLAFSFIHRSHIAAVRQYCAELLGISTASAAGAALVRDKIP
ncbi:MAG: hypothetical protein PHS97_01915 [Oscillospiraceae bacterium]|nr:hypothetical protein [Oscillospiraceae bacterium]